MRRKHGRLRGRSRESAYQSSYKPFVPVAVVSSREWARASVAEARNENCIPRDRTLCTELCARSDLYGMCIRGSASTHTVMEMRRSGIN
jgi:hypothetical protein